jgi:hypothetical protein
MSTAKRATPLSAAERTARRPQRSGDLEVPSAAHAGGPVPPTGAASPLPALPGEDRAPGDLPSTAQRRRRAKR